MPVNLFEDAAAEPLATPQQRLMYMLVAIANRALHPRSFLLPRPSRDHSLSAGLIRELQPLVTPQSNIYTFSTNARSLFSSLGTQCGPTHMAALLLWLGTEKFLPLHQDVLRRLERPSDPVHPVIQEYVDASKLIVKQNILANVLLTSKNSAFGRLPAGFKLAFQGLSVPAQLRVAFATLAPIETQTYLPMPPSPANNPSLPRAAALAGLVKANWMQNAIMEELASHLARVQIKTDPGYEFATPALDLYAALVSSIMARFQCSLLLDTTALDALFVNTPQQVLLEVYAANHSPAPDMPPKQPAASPDGEGGKIRVYVQAFELPHGLRLELATPCPNPRARQMTEAPDAAAAGQTAAEVAADARAHIEFLVRWRPGARGVLQLSEVLMELDAVEQSPNGAERILALFPFGVFPAPEQLVIG